MHLFSANPLSVLDPTRIPRHVAIIPDGNRRWAKEHAEHLQKGHRAGASILIDTVEAAKTLGIQVVTFYLFSTENWNRPKEEVDALMWLLVDFLESQTPQMIAKGVRLHTIGAISALPNNALEAVEKARKQTASCNQIDMILALNYGGRDEIRRAVERIVERRKKTEEPITEEMISQSLDTAAWGDPDLLIRTSGEMRLSNFLLWQLSYTELYMADVLWPDFTPDHLLQAVTAFQARERRLGGA